MKTYKNLHEKVHNIGNLILAWRKARKGKTKKDYAIEFEKDLIKNLLNLQEEIKNQTYFPKPLKTFILRDPKTRKISKATFRDRIVHHAVVNILEPIFERVFIYDNCANRKTKGNLFALRRFDKFKRKVSKNGKSYDNKFNDLNLVYSYCLKADIKHYFQEVDHEILLNIIKRKVKDKRVIYLIRKILENSVESNPLGKGIPLGNLTSQFFANVYLDKLDKFVKHQLKAKYYVRYVDDFVILHEFKEQLSTWKTQIDNFLNQELKLELHKDKSQVLPLSKGVDFVGFRNFYYFRLLRKRNINSIKNKIKLFNNELISYDKFVEIFQGWNAYATWANSLKLRRKIVRKIYSKK